MFVMVLPSNSPAMVAERCSRNVRCARGPARIRRAIGAGVVIIDALTSEGLFDSTH